MLKIYCGTFLQNDDGVNIVTEYIVTFVLAMFIFTIFITMSQSMFIDTPKRTVCQNQFIDIGNDVDTKLIDTYLVAPENGSIRTNFYIPPEVAGYHYTVGIRTSPNGLDKEVTVYSIENNIFAKLTLNGVNSTIPVSGNTSSLNSLHTIRYSSR